MSTDKTFLGTGWSFPPQFNLRADENAGELGVMMVSDEKDIEQSIFILLSTVRGERVMVPEYGCGIKKLVFEPLDDVLVGKVKIMVEQAILLFEPRVKLEEIDVTSEVVQGGRTKLNIHLHYIIKKINNRANMVYPFYLQEGTNI